MVCLLSRLFIKDYKNYQNPQTRNAYGILCGSVGIFLNLILFVCKLIISFMSGSIAITADAINNLSDAGSSVVTLLGFKLSSAKPDSEHPFGHGRMEYIAGFVVSGFILLMAFELIKSSITKIIHPQPTELHPIIVIVLLASILVKLYMFYYNKSFAKKLSSTTMNATATDSISDCFATLIVLLSTVFTHFSGIIVDGYCGLIVGLFIFYAGIMAAKDTIDPLLGKPADPMVVKHIEEIVNKHKEVLGMHDLVIHDYGPGRMMISLHAEVPAEGDILFLHDIIDNIEIELQNSLNCSATIHLDPIDLKNEKRTQLKEKTKNLLETIDSSLTFHDFRMVSGPTHTNLIYDVVVPFTYSCSDQQLIEAIREATKKEIGENYRVVIQIDHKYS